jgi:hypothetical protein
MSGSGQSLNLSRSPPYFAALLLVALVAFWPSYLSLGISGNPGYVHLHAITSALWMLMLIVQPILISRRRVTLHRLVGKSSYVLAPTLIVSVVLLAHYRMNAVPADAYAIQTYILYLQISLGIVFAMFYVLAIAYRYTTVVHARFMVCTALTLIDPIFARIIGWVMPDMILFSQWISFGLTDLVLIGLIWLERESKAGRKIFPIALAIFILAQLPALLGFDRTDSWQQFARWFAALPIS